MNSFIKLGVDNARYGLGQILVGMKEQHNAEAVLRELAELSDLLIKATARACGTEGNFHVH